MIIRSTLALGVLYLAISPLGAQNSAGGSSAGSAVVVEIDGQKLTSADIERKRSGALFQARNTFFIAQRKAVDDFIDDYLLEQQAAKEKLTVDQLLEKHVKSTLPKDPDDEALRLYYEGLNTTETYEHVRPQILDHIKKGRMDRAKAAYVKTLKNTAVIAIKVPPPRVEIPMKDTPVRGEATAKVTIVEYADYECPYCQQIQPTLEKLEAEFKGRVAFAYKDVPLPMHANAQKASEAAHCAATQGKYWEYHDKLFSTRQLAVPQLKDHARDLNLDLKAFDQCLDSGAKAGLVKSQLNEAMGLQIQGTPAFFINGRFLSGGLSYEQLRDVLEEEIAVASSHGSQTAHR